MSAPEERRPASSPAASRHGPIGHVAPSDLQRSIERTRAAAGKGDPASIRRLRGCEIVERYDLMREPREGICAGLGISERTFYLDRSAFFKQFARADARRNGPRARALAEDSLLSAAFQNAEFLYQLDALDAAAARLRSIALGTADENAKVTALSRLAEVECDAGRAGTADFALASAHAALDRSGEAATDRARAELLVAQARYAFARKDTAGLEGATDRVWWLSTQALTDADLWLSAVRASSRAGVYRYIERDIAGAARACGKAAAALEHTSGKQPLARCRLLTARGLIDTHDPQRVHLAWTETADAYRIAIENSIITSACDALYNALLFMLFCDEPFLGSDGPLWDDVPGAAHALAVAANDAMVGAVAAAGRGGIDEAISLLDRARAEYHQGAFDWNPAFSTMQARMLFKARRFGAAELVARTAVKEWERAGLRGEGTALRVRAEALEALGRRRTASAVVADAIEALEPNSPIHQLLATYRCANRLTPRAAYRERIEHLKDAIDSMVPGPFWENPSPASKPVKSARLSTRERQVALLAADGLTNPAIARSLGISTKTVANHLAVVFERLNLRARWQLSRSVLEADAE